MQILGRPHGWHTRVRITVAIFLSLTGFLASAVAAEVQPLAMDVSMSRVGAGGKFRYLGTYPGSSSPTSNATVTALPDDRLFMYGVRFERFLPGSGTNLTTRNRERMASSLMEQPLLWNPQRRAWKRLERPPQCPHNHLLATATALPSGGILITGGVCDAPRLGDDTSPRLAYKKTSLWNSKTGLWEDPPSLSTTRILHSASLLKDASVLIVGGESDPLDSPDAEPVLATVERFSAGKVENLASLHEARASHTASVLHDGTVLVAGGFDAKQKALASVEIWDNTAQAWHTAPPLQQARYGHSASLLGDGRVMIAGGVGSQGLPINSVELWEPGAHAWSAGKPMLLPSRNHATAVLANGDVLVTGGFNRRNKSVWEAMLWDQATGNWTLAGSHQDEESDMGSLTVALLPMADGGARLVGLTGVWQWLRADAGAATHHPSFPDRVRHSLTALLDGRVLLSGGLSGNIFLDGAQLFDPSTGRLP